MKLTQTHRLMPVYSTPAPSSPIQLYAGPIEVRQGTYTGEGIGAVNLFWRLKGPEVQFHVPSLQPVDFLQTDDCLIDFASIGRNIPAFLFDVAISSGLNNSALGVQGACRNIVVGSDQLAAHVLFHVVNFQPFVHPRPDPAPDDYDVHRVVFEGGGWRVTLQGVNQISELEKQAHRESGFAITHVGMAERVDGTLFSRVTARDLLRALHVFLSFARGAWSPPILFVGRDAMGGHIWEDWAVRQATPCQTNLSWFPSFQPECLAAIFPRFMELWQNADTQEILDVAIHWYIEANLGSGAIEGAIILCQTGLERLAYYILVHDRARLRERDFQPGGLNAAERVRRLFNEFQLPISVGAPRLRINALPALAIAQTLPWADAPDGLVRLRNCLVHPDARNSQRLQAFPPGARAEAWALCLWYYEVVLLKWFGYSGKYVNRQTASYQGEVEQLP